MADAKVAAPAAPKVPTPATDAVKKPEADATKEKKKGRKDWQLLYPTAEAATKEAGSRDYGPRRAYTVEVPAGIKGGTYHLVGWNGSEGAGLLLESFGATVTEVGKAPRAAKVVGPDAVRSMVEEMAKSNPEYAKILAQLDALAKVSAPK